MHIYEKMGLELALERNRGWGRLEYSLHKSKMVHYLFALQSPTFQWLVKLSMRRE